MKFKFMLALIFVIGCGEDQQFSSKVAQNYSETPATSEQPVEVIETVVEFDEDTIFVDEPVVEESFVETETLFRTTMAFGVGLEDGGDNDFNDISVCLEGAFQIDVAGNTITSLVAQEVQVTTKSITGNRGHIVRVFQDALVEDQILLEEAAYAFNEERISVLSFTEGQVLKLAIGHSAHTNYSQGKTLSDDKVILEKDKCRNKGR